MELMQVKNKKNLLIKSFSNKTKSKSESLSKNNEELSLNHSIQNNIKKLTIVKKYNTLKKRKTLNIFFEKYISEK